MTTQKEQRGFSNFGFSTILLSFVMICVVTFSALSLVTANSDYKLSKKVADKTQGYYAAEELVYEKLAALDNIFMESYLETSSKAGYYAAVEKMVDSYANEEGSDATEPYIIWEETSDGYLLSIKEKITDDHHLSVTISVLYPTKDSDTFYQVLEWKSVYTTETPEDDTLNLIQ